ncbi:hypothetical protein HC823_01025, partial [Candidatus Gracilibacteria bacterium]|nr:hypothetical protein [Candidatus Gracilibacteria bacterium]
MDQFGDRKGWDGHTQGREQENEFFHTNKILDSKDFAKVIKKSENTGEKPIFTNKNEKNSDITLVSTGAFLGLFLSASVLASEIDWDASNLVINFAPEISGGQMLECFGSTGPNIVKSLSELGLSDSNTTLSFDNTNPCFRIAGTYNVSIELWDTAGNSATEVHPEFVIKAADPDAGTSSFSGGCVGKVADSIDTCDFNLTLKDEFENLVTQVGTVQIFSPTGEVSDQANQGTKFREGLQMEGVSFPNTASTEFAGILNNGEGVFHLSALAPSVQWTNGTVEGDKYLVKYELQPMQFQINTPSIDDNGNVESNFAVANVIDQEMDVQFIPPFQIIPTLPADEYVTLDEAFDVDFNLSAVEQEPSDFSKFSDIKAVGIENIEGHNFVDENNVNTLPPTFDYGAVSTLPVAHILQPRITAAEDDIDANFSVVSMISYLLGGQTITYPAGGFGLPETLGVEDELNADPVIKLVGYADDSAEIEILGFAVEGGSLRGKDDEQMFLLEGGTGDRMAHIGAIDETDIRSAVSRNAFELVRGAEATTFADDNVVVKEGDVILSEVLGGSATAPSGKNTLVVKNGNLIITQDLTYADPANDSFGVMLINDATESMPAKGNIFVRDNVQKIVGTYYADGGIMANAGTDVLNGNSSASSNQLLLTGMLLTKNTKGGSISLDTDTGQYYTPWEEAEKSVAKRYDLDYVRRYNSNTTEGKIEGQSRFHFILPNGQKQSGALRHR